MTEETTTTTIEIDRSGCPTYDHWIDFKNDDSAEIVGSLDTEEYLSCGKVIEAEIGQSSSCLAAMVAIRYDFTVLYSLQFFSYNRNRPLTTEEMEVLDRGAETFQIASRITEEAASRFNAGKLQTALSSMSSVFSQYQTGEDFLTKEPEYPASMSGESGGTVLDMINEGVEEECIDPGQW